MKNIIVTGANGTLSTAIASWLRNKGEYNVRQISVRGDDWLQNDFHSIDCIVHIAGITPQNIKNDDDYEKINYELTQKIANKAKTDSVAQFIYISSMAVYGLTQQINPEKGIILSNTPCAPSSEYGKSKLKAETYLTEIADDDFTVSIIRVPSIYGKGKTEYLDQFKHLAKKMPFIPYAFSKNYKSAIYTENLCELIYLIIKNKYSGIVCPDDGPVSAIDFCTSIYPKMRTSKLLGRIIEFFLQKNDRIVDYYGAIYYSVSLTNIFNGNYRIIPFREAVRKTYEK